MAADRACHRRQPRQRGAVADVHQQHQPHTRLGRLHAGQRPFLLHAVRGTWLAPIRRGWIGTGVHPALWQQELCHGGEAGHLRHRLQGHAETVGEQRHLRAAESCLRG